MIRRPWTTLALCGLVCSAGGLLLAADQAPVPPAQRGGAIQTPTGGRGPGAAPEADDPANATADLSPKPPVVALSPEDQAKRFWLPPGFRMEAVLADPLIDSAAEITFDGNGRMYLVELRGYEQTIDGIDALTPVGRISRHEDRDNNGTFETHSVFVDHLLFPRFALPIGADSILTLETNNDEVWRYTDTNGDGVADRKELFTNNFGRGGSMESQPSGLLWAMDNWLYSTVNAFRLRWTPHGVLREPTGPNRAQWSVAQDDDGKVWFQHGASGMPGYFQFPVHYGNFDWPDQFEPDLNILWGAPILVGDIQAGIPGTRLPDGSLIYGTASAGNEIFRGHRMPADMVGDYFYGEEVARVVRRLKVVKDAGLTQLRNAYPRSEFLRSLDPLFRPVDMATGPDGVMYIADMYRGIIEGALWAKEGTYLRQKIRQYQLDKVLGHGRVWRLTYDGIAPDRTQPRMLAESSTTLVTRLTHPNGWWRDTAQQLLVLRQDKSVVPGRVAMARRAWGARPGGSATAPSPLARMHALWTLEGLGALDATLVRELVKDAEPRMRVQAIRASESLYKAGDRSLAADWRAAAADGNPDVVIQALLTMNLFKVAEANATAKVALDRQPGRGVRFVADRILNPPATLAGAGRGGLAGLTTDQQESIARGATIYAEICFSCHGDDGRGTPQPGAAAGLTMAPSLAGSARVTGHRDYVIKTLLHGLTGPIDGRAYPQVMMPLGTNADTWIADVTNYVRSGFGNSAAPVSSADVARTRAATTARRTPWTYAEITASLPRLLVPDATWRVTASHNADTARAGLDYTRWSSGVPQQAGMWFQVELPASTVLTELQFESQVIAGGRGGPPPTTGHPRAFQVTLSTDGTTWGAPVAEAQGAGRTTVAAFAPTAARFVRITLTGGGDGAPPWTIERLRLYAAPADGPAPGGSR